MKKICIIAQFPPPMHGLAKAIETLYNSELKAEFNFEKINLTSNFEILKNLFIIARSKANLFYFTISQTKGGNLRDLLILTVIHIQKKQCIIHLHGGYYRKLVDNDMAKWQRKANYKILQQVSGAIVLGDSLKFIFEGMISDEKIFVVPNCVDNEYMLNNKAFDEKLSKLENKTLKHILYLSNFIPSKGYRDVLEIVKFEKERCGVSNKKKYHFDFAGKFFEDLEKQFFFNYIKENNLEDYITYHGEVSGDTKKKLLEKSDVFILLTRYLNEGQPISILEAMGNGMVIITTNHAGIPDIVKNEENGIVCCMGEKTNDILIQLEKMDMMSIVKRNRQCILDNYSEKMYLKKLGTLFKKVEGE